MSLNGDLAHLEKSVRLTSYWNTILVSPMKKLIIRILIILGVLVIVAVVCIGMFLDAALKKGVETVGSAITKVEVKLNGASLSMISGSGKLNGLVVGNPEGYKTPSAISVGSASLSIKPASLFSDKLVIRSINLQAPEITFETDLKSNNLKKLMANLEETTGGSGKTKTSTPETDKKANRKLEVDEFVISGAKVNVSITAMGGQSATVTIPEIRLVDLGTGPDGITAAELTKRVLNALIESSGKAAASGVGDLSKTVSGLTKDLGKGSTGGVEKITKGVSDLLRKPK